MSINRSAQIGVVLSATDAEALKLATLHLRKQLGDGFLLTDGPICEAGLYEVNCSLSIPTSTATPRLRIVARNVD